MTFLPCKRCGRPVRRERRSSAESARREIRCSRCLYLLYDYPRPCAGMIVARGRSILVLRRAHLPRRGFLDLPGGFMEPGEGIEAAARRELLEETGLRVGRAEELGFYWDRYYLKGFGHFPTMNFYYLARWRSGEPRAAADAASAEWMPIGQMGRSRARMAWAHMADVIRDVKRRL